MMQKDIRVTIKNHIHFNHISILKGDMLFFTHIIDKYGIETRLKAFPYLQYLMKNRVDKTSSSFQYFSTIQKKSYHNQIINKVSIDNSRIHAHKNQNITSFYHKDLTNILQNSLESETLVPNITRIKSSVPSFSKSIIRNHSLVNESLNVINLYYENSLQNKILKEENQNITSFYHKDLTNILQNSLESETLVPNITRIKSSVSSVKNTRIDYKTFTLNNRNMRSIHSQSLLHSNLINDDKTIKNTTTTTQNATIIYNKEKTKTSSEPIINEKVVKKIIHETNMVENSHHEPSKVVEHTVNDLNPYDIKKLATKIYPFIINQWQKEFERRGVFYG